MCLSNINVSVCLTLMSVCFTMVSVCLHYIDFSMFIIYICQSVSLTLMSVLHWYQCLSYFDVIVCILLISVCLSYKCITMIPVSFLNECHCVRLTLMSVFLSEWHFVCFTLMSLCLSYIGDSVFYIRVNVLSYKLSMSVLQWWQCLKYIHNSVLHSCQCVHLILATVSVVHWCQSVCLTLVTMCLFILVTVCLIIVTVPVLH